MTESFVLDEIFVSILDHLHEDVWHLALFLVKFFHCLCLLDFPPPLTLGEVALMHKIFDLSHIHQDPGGETMTKSYT